MTAGELYHVLFGRTSEVRLRQPGDAVSQLDGEAAPFEIGQRQSPGARLFRVEHRVELVCELGRVALDRVFEVEAQAAGIPVRRADQRPSVVNDEQFRMI